MGKSKKSNDSTIDETEESGSANSKSSWDEKIKYLSPIASPLASKKMTKKLYKLASRANAFKSLRKGIKEVQKSLRKGEKGILLLAGDVSPLDIICHIPIVCEESDIPYCYTPSKGDLGQAHGSQRHCCVVLVKKHESYADDFDELASKIGQIPTEY